jgi:prevent-host-death family protein
VQRSETREFVDAKRSRDYSDYMIANLREAKSNLSQLVQRAADGEEIIITVRGQPKARLTGIISNKMQNGDRAEWVAELSAAAEAARVGPLKSTSQQFWDELREERL